MTGNSELSRSMSLLVNAASLAGLMLVVVLLYFVFAGWPPGEEWWINNAAGIIGTMITAAGLIVGVAVVAYQLGAQHRSSLIVLREGKREELKLKIYEGLMAKATAYLDASREARTYATFVASDSALNLANKAVNMPPYVTPRRVPEFVRLHGAAGMAASVLMLEIEKWEIAVERIEVFRYVIANTNRKTSDMLHELLQAMLPILPVDIDGNVRVQNYGEEQMERLAEVVGRYEELSWDLNSYVFDLTVEIQNALLSSLFDRRVMRREPPDPATNIVITTDEADYLGIVQRFKMEH